MNPKFLLKEDMIIKLDIAGNKKEIKLFDKGKIFEANERGEYIIESMVGKTISSEEDMRKSTNDSKELIFEEIEEKIDNNIDLIIEEVPIDDELNIKRWRIQIDVTTSRKKLKEIEKYINQNIKRLL